MSDILSKLKRYAKQEINQQKWIQTMSMQVVETDPKHVDVNSLGLFLLIEILKVSFLLCIPFEFW